MRRSALVGSLAALASLVLLGGCDEFFEGSHWPDCPEVQYPERHPELVTIDQGLWGDVWFWQGEFMPMCPSGVVFAVSREMQIYEVAGSDDVDMFQYGGFYSAVHTPLVAVVQSGENGFFEVALEPGRYSLFAVEDSLLYANGADGYGNICPVTVDTGQVVGVTFDITYESTR